jgi:hypothetical protein
LRSRHGSGIAAEIDSIVVSRVARNGILLRIVGIEAGTRLKTIIIVVAMFFVFLLPRCRA